MRTIAHINEEVMVREFLRAEINSKRFSEKLIATLDYWGIPKSIIENGNLNDRENFIRRWLLAERRGYHRGTHLFAGFPRETEWKTVMLEEKDLPNLLYGNHEEWVELSAGSRKVQDGVYSLQKQCSFKFLKNICGTLWELRDKLELPYKTPPIVVSHDGEKLVLLEGHTRATAYMLAGATEMQVIYGLHTEMDKWMWY